MEITKEQQQKWKEISGYNGKYLISNLGNCKIADHLNTTGNKYLTQRVDRAGYLTVRLSKGGDTKTKFVHRLLAEAFVPNHMGKPEVNHRNGNKLDNRLMNLEWVTHQENVQHAHNLRLIPRAWEKKLIDQCTGAKYDSIKEAAEKMGIKYSTLRSHVNGRSKNKTCLKYLNA